MEGLKERIAHYLLEIQAVFLRPNEPFTWASGIKSPIYTDNRLILGYPRVCQQVELGLVQLIKKHHPKCEAIMGTATAGIAHAAIVSSILELPTGYVRGENKEHGRNNLIEGRLIPGQKVVLIEDLISTGGSVLKAAEALREAGGKVLGVLAIFTYGMKKARDAFEAAGLPLHCLTDLDMLCKVAVMRGDIKAEDEQKLILFRDTPSDESWQKS